MLPLQTLPLLHEAHAPPEPPPVSRETHEALWALCEHVVAWNRTVRLAGAGDPDTLWATQVVPCLALRAWLPRGGRLLDFGSGQGFPGLVMAIASGFTTVLIDSDRRKAAFLRHVSMTMRLETIVIADRVEHVAPQRAAFVTARGFGNAASLALNGVRHAAPDGVCVFLKGPELLAEFSRVAQSAERTWSVQRLADRQWALVGTPRTGE